MNLIPWRDKRKREAEHPAPLSRFDQLRQEMDQLFDRVMRSPFGLDLSETVGSMNPRIEVSDTADEVVVRAEIPGVDPAKLELTLSGDLLTLAGTKDEKEERKEENLFFSDRRYGSFRRSIQLPCRVDRERIEASCKDGILIVRLTKIEGEKPQRIQIAKA